MTIHATTFRFRKFELEQIDRLKEEMRCSSRADAIRAAIQFATSESGKDFRAARRFENFAIARVDELRRAYGPHARMEITVDEAGNVSLTIEGDEPRELHPVLRPFDDKPEVAALLIVDDETDLALDPDVAVERNAWRGGFVSLTALYPRVGPDGVRTPLRDPHPGRPTTPEEVIE